MLSDVDIREAIKTGELVLLDPNGQPVIDPSTSQEREQGQLQAHGYALRIEAVFSWDELEFLALKEGQKYVLPAGDAAVIRTYERLRLGPSISGTLHALARRTLLGLCHISTTVHPGWAANEAKPQPLYVSVYNFGKASIELKKGERFCRLLLYKMRSPAQLPAPTLRRVSEAFEGARLVEESRHTRRSKGIGGPLLSQAPWWRS